MNPESVTQSEVSQSEKKKYRILMHIYGLHRTGTDDLTGREGTETQT